MCSQSNTAPFGGMRIKKSVLAISSALGLSIPTLGVSAQEQAAANAPVEEVVITGTLIRGIEPTGSQTIGIDTEAIIESGAVSTNDILGTLPQATNFFQSRTSLEPQAVDFLTVSRPNLRNLPGFQQASGSATLVLVDGHRIVGMGVRMSAVDPDLLPPGVIERVEVITDGGSSLYGADAIGGVINFITKKDFEGVEIDAGYTTGEDYWSYDTNITAGTTWTDGSGYISLSHSDRDAILNGDRDWTTQGIWSDSGVSPTGIECNSPVGTSQTMTYTPIPSHGVSVWLPGEANLVGSNCNRVASDSFLPEEERTSVFFGASQTLSESTSLDVKGYYSERITTWDEYPLGDIVAFGPGTFALSPTAEPFEQREAGSVGFSYAPSAAYQHRNGETVIETYGITPELTVDLSNGWQLRSLLHYSKSENSVTDPDSNDNLLAEYVESGAIDPLDIAGSDVNAVADVLNWETAGESEQELFMARMIADGALFELPAGEVRMAAGLEYQDQTARLRQQDVVIGGLGAEDYPEVGRDVKAAFAEVLIPLLSGKPGVESLDLSASVRHDDYSDFGTTTNPHVGITYRPVDWISIHANWGESFNAPTLMDELNAVARFGFNPGTIAAVEAAAAAAGETIEEGRTDTTQVLGAEAGLDPQTADTWAAGFEISPPAVEGLEFSVNYYEIEFRDILGSFDPRSTSAATAFRDRYIWNPTQAELEAAAAITFNGADELVNIDPSKVGVIIDRRTTNTDEATLKGVDFSISYFHDTSIGTLSYRLAGNHQTEFELSSAGGEFVDQLDKGQPTTTMTGSVNWQQGNWRSKLTVKHTASFDVDDAAEVDGVPLQTSVDSFTTADLFVGYEFQGEGLIEDLSVRLNVGNIFDEEPPVYRRNDQTPYNGYTSGRVFTLGFTKRFQ